jgi:hypothetical protein
VERLELLLLAAMDRRLQRPHMQNASQIGGAGAGAGPTTPFLLSLLPRPYTVPTNGSALLSLHLFSFSIYCQFTFVSHFPIASFTSVTHCLSDPRRSGEKSVGVCNFSRSDPYDNCGAVGNVVVSVYRPVVLNSTRRL